MKSPLRNDKNEGSFWIFEVDNKICWKDFASDDDKGDVFQLVKKLFGVNYNNALTRIATDMGLINSKGEDTRIVIAANPDRVPDQKRHCNIQVVAKRWNSHELAYWAEYGINANDLKVDDVVAVREWFINRIRQPIEKDERVFAYKYDEGFQVLRPDRKKVDKWKTNMPLNYLDGWDKVNGCEKVLITKAKKDKIYLQKLLPFPVIRVMNESIAAFTPEIVEKLRGKQVWCNFDNDTSGKKASYKVTELLQCKHLNAPDALLKEGITDMTDWRRVRGNDNEVIDHLKLKGLL